MKAGFISLIGRPNVGKSTLLNMIVGEKVAIMSPTAQTTRTIIQGIKTTDAGQMIFVDTPGIHKPQDALGSFMNDAASIGTDGVDVICFLSPVDENFGKGDQYILDMLKKYEGDIPIIGVITKIDKKPKEKILAKITTMMEAYPFTEIIPVSARKKENLVAFEDLLLKYLPESEFLFDEETISIQTDQFVVREFIREKILHLTKEEVPHAVAIVLDVWDETTDSLEITASIVVERKSQKGIIIGKQGAMIKEIRLQAERDLKRHFGKKVELELWVKVEKDWRSNPKYLHSFGYDLTDYE